MTLQEVLHALVNLLPQDWDLEAHHAAVDQHFDGPKQPAKERTPKDPAKD